MYYLTINFVRSHKKVNSDRKAEEEISRNQFKLNEKLASDRSFEEQLKRREFELNEKVTDFNGRRSFFFVHQAYALRQKLGNKMMR